MDNKSNQEILDMLQLMLKRRTFFIPAQSRLGYFTSEVRKMSPDVVLMDQHLGWADGCDLCAS